MKPKNVILTCIVFPLIDVTTSPGFVALPLGMFSVSGMKPGKKIVPFMFPFGAHAPSCKTKDPFTWSESERESKNFL